MPEIAAQFRCMLPYTARQNEAIEYRLPICSPMIAISCHGFFALNALVSLELLPHQDRPEILAAELSRDSRVPRCGRLWQRRN
jgi:hypothetical protein